MNSHKWNKNKGLSIISPRIFPCPPLKEKENGQNAYATRNMQIANLSFNKNLTRGNQDQQLFVFTVLKSNLHSAKTIH